MKPKHTLVQSKVATDAVPLLINKTSSKYRKMTEGTVYPHPRHRLGEFSHRLLAPASHHQPLILPVDSLYRILPFATMDYQDQYSLPKASPSAHRSLSFASMTSSNSHHSPFRPESGALAPASVISVPALSKLTLAQRRLSHLHPALSPSHIPHSAP